MFIQVWLLPVAFLVVAVIISIPLSRYITWLMNGQYKPLVVMGWFENKLNSGQQNWKQYLASLLIFNTLLFVFGYLVLALQPLLPFNPDGKTLLAPSAIFNSVASFITNTDLQHYAGDQHLSNFSQIFFGISSLFFSAAVGLCALTALIRGLTGDQSVGNFFVDMWRVVVYMFVPIAPIRDFIYSARHAYDPADCLSGEYGGAGCYGQNVYRRS